MSSNMMSPGADATSIRVQDLAKAYRIYATPGDRLRQALAPRLRRLFAPVLRLLGRPLDPPPYFTEFWALRGLSFEVARGETLGIIGRNGSGKSTLLQLVCGTLTPTTGDVQVQGRVAALLELGSGFNPEYTGRENVLLNASVLGLTREETLARMDAILAFADIGEFVEQPVKTYSSGMAMRLAFAVIAHVDADVLIIDEALAVGDAYFQQKCFRWLRDFQKRGTVLFCGHDPGAIQSLCSRAIWLDRGVVRLQGPAKEVTEAYAAFVGAASMGLGDDVVKLAAALGGGDGTAAGMPFAAMQGMVPVRAGGTTYGSGRARILALGLTDADGASVSMVPGDAEVTLTLRFQALEDIEGAIAGFSVKDRLGQAVLAENTYDPGFVPETSLLAGGIYHARFRFLMPGLAPGQYSLTPAIASGTQDQHVQHHWVDDALIFQVVPRRNLGAMLMVPMIERAIEEAAPVPAPLG